MKGLQMSDIHDMPAPEDYQPGFPGQVKTGMTIAEEIVKATFGRMMEDGGSCYVSGLATFDKKEIESIIFAKLGPIRGQLSNVRHDLAAILAGLRNADVDVKEMEDRTRESLGRVRSILSMLDDS